MLHEQDPAPAFASHGLQHLTELLGLVAVEPGRRLVEQEHVERPGERAGQLDQAPLSDRQQAHLGVGNPRGAGQLEGLADDL